MYCEKCGRRLIAYRAKAENFVDPKTIYKNMKFGYRPRSYPKFNKETGERNYIKAFKCPKANIFNNHDNFGGGELPERKDIVDRKVYVENSYTVIKKYV